MLLESETDIKLALVVAAMAGLLLSVLFLVLWLRAAGALRAVEGSLTKTEVGADRAERRLYEILNAIPVALVETDMAGKFVFANRAAHQLLGRKDAELLGLRFHSATWGITYPDGRLIPPDLLPAARALRGQTVKGFLHLIVNPNTRKKMLVSVTAQPILNALGEVIGSSSALVETESLTPAGSDPGDSARGVYFDLAGELLMAVGPDGRIRDVNASGARLLGSGAAVDLVGVDWFAFLPDSDRDDARAAFARVVAGQEDLPEMAEATIVGRDGAPRRLRFRARALRDESHRFAVGLIAAEDISDSAAAAEESDRQGHVLRMAQEAGGVGAWSVDFTSGEVTNSPNMERVWGLRAQSTADVEKQMEMIHPEDRARVDAAVAAVLEGRAAVYDAEFRIVRPDGAVSWLVGHGEPIRDAAGAVVGVRGVNYDVTPLKSAQAALAESERRFAQTADAAPVMMAMLDASGGLAWANRRWLDLTGAAIDTQTGAGWRSLLGPADQARFDEVLSSCAADGRAATVRLDLTTPQGAVLAFEGTLAPRGAEGAAHSGFVLVGEDATSIRLANEKLAASEATQRALLNRDGLYAGVCEPSGDSWIFVMLNEGAARVLGGRADAWPQSPETLPATAAPGRIAAWRERMDRVIASGQSETWDYALEDEGRRLWVQVTASPAPAGPEGRPRVAFFAIDVTASRQASAALTESESRFRALVEAAPQLIWSCRADGYCDYVSAQWVEYTGVEASHHHGVGWQEAVHPDDRPAAARAWRAAVLGEAPYDVVYRLRRHDGVWRWFQARGAAVKDETGAVQRWFGANADVTEIVAAGEELERRVAERTRELEASLEERRRAEAALAQAQRLETVGRLTGGVAHDFNNLLTVVIGALDMMMRQADKPDRVRRLGEAALAAGRRGERLTRQLMAFSRRQEFKLETLSLAAVVRGFEPILRRAVAESTPLRIEADDSIGQVEIDVVQFEAALLNLVVNARDAVKDGGSITVRAERVSLADGDLPETPAGDFARITVEDTGAGMSSEVAARAFEPFFTTKEVGEGSGLGLAQVYGFARQSGGGAQIESEPGRGSRVSMFLPVATGPAAPAEPVQEPASQETDRSQAGRRVLLVEDDLGVRTVVENLLLEMGCDVVAAEDGPAALRILDSGAPFDLLLSDVVMPGGLSGVELANHAQAARPSLKVILSTGYAADHLDNVGERGWSILRKPFQGGALSRALRAALG